MSFKDESKKTYKTHIRALKKYHGKFIRKENKLMKLPSPLRKVPLAYWLDIFPILCALIFYLYLQLFLFPSVKNSFLSDNQIVNADEDQSNLNSIENTTWVIQFLIDQNGNTPLVEFYYGNGVAHYMNTVTFLENNRFESSFPFFSDNSTTGFYTYKDGDIVLTPLNGQETADLHLVSVEVVDNLMVNDLSLYYPETDSLLLYIEPYKEAILTDDFPDGWVALVFVKKGE